MKTKEVRVLIVDDDDDIRANIQDILSDLGYRTDTAHDGPSAIQLVRRHVYDVALLDFKLPGTDGATLYREMKQIRPEIVAIMVTAYAGGHGASRALDAGTWKVLQKPVDIRQLLSLIEEASQAPSVLVVDDDREFCETLWQVLRDHHYRIAIAHDEENGIQKARDCSYQVALIDLHLRREDGGHGDGRSVLECVRRTHPNAKTVVVTGYRGEADQMTVGPQEKTATSVCYKPVDMAELLNLIEAEL